MSEDSDETPGLDRRAVLHEFAVRAHDLERQRQLDDAARDAIRALQEAGVDSLLLKGPALAQLLYRRGEHRGYFDIDLLIAPDRFADARRVLERLGYASMSDPRGIDDVGGVEHGEVWTRAASESGPIVIDLHWRLDGCGDTPERSWNVLTKRRVWLELAGDVVPTLDRPALALHVAMHAAQHGEEDVKALGDLSRALARWPREDWRETAILAAELNAADSLAAGLSLLPDGIVLAEELDLPRNRALEWSVANKSARPRGTFHAQAFAEARGLGARLDIVRRSLLPTRAWIVWHYPWAAQSRLLLSAAYALHLLRAPVWAVRALRFRRRAKRAGRRTSR